MTRNEAYNILNPLQNKVAFAGINVDIITFSGFMSEGEELANYVKQKQFQYKNLN